MSKKRWQLKSVSQILRAIKEKKTNRSSQTPPRNVSLDDFSKLLISQIKVIDEKVEILERNFPIQEGRSCVDLLAHNRSGDLILIWTPEMLKSKRLIDLIAEYDWMKKNVSLWQHLFPQATHRGELQVKIWFFAAEMDSNLNTILFYLKGIPLKIFQYSYRNWENKLSLLIKPWMQLKVEKNPLSIPEERPNFKPNPSETPHLRAVPPPKQIPAITQEEIKDLLQGLDANPAALDMFEDEITEPFFNVKDLKLEKA